MTPLKLEQARETLRFAAVCLFSVGPFAAPFRPFAYSRTEILVTDGTILTNNCNSYVPSGRCEKIEK
jgi:hypothetical protein